MLDPQGCDSSYKVYYPERWGTEAVGQTRLAHTIPHSCRGHLHRTLWTHDGLQQDPNEAGRLAQRDLASCDTADDDRFSKQRRPFRSVMAGLARDIGAEWCGQRRGVRRAEVVHDKL